MIKDSGERRQFDTGAVRDIQEGKGRCDLLPLDIAASLIDTDVLSCIHLFKDGGKAIWLKQAIDAFCKERGWNKETMLLEVAIHFEEGHKKYPPDADGTPNWQKGIPCSAYIDSGVRHYLKWRRGDTDEPHDRACIWNLMACWWTRNHLPELNSFKENEDAED